MTVESAVAARTAPGTEPLLFDVLNALELGVVLLEPARAEIVSLNLAAEHLLQVTGIEPTFATLDRLFPARDGAPPTVQFGVALLGYATHDVAGGLRCLALRDVTESARLESIARAVNVMDNAGSIFAAVRHELGNPLNSIKTILAVLAANLERHSARTIGDHIARCLSEIGRMETLLRSLKSFSLYERPALEVVALEPFLDGFLRLVSQQLETRGIRVETRIAPDAAALWTDPRALSQVLLNLAINAMDALLGRPAPELVIASRRSGAHVVLTVADNGAGIPAEQLCRLFRPFHSTKPHGTGLGLVIAQKLLAHMGGRIALESEAGTGTVVTLTLPAEAGARIGA